MADSTVKPDPVESELCITEFKQDDVVNELIGAKHERKRILEKADENKKIYQQLKNNFRTLKKQDIVDLKEIGETKSALTIFKKLFKDQVSDLTKIDKTIAGLQAEFRRLQDRIDVLRAILENRDKKGKILEFKR